MKSVEQISLLELLFSGQVLTNIFTGIILFLGMIMLYSFFLKYFCLKEIGSNTDDFLANIADCIYDHRIDAAKDWCRRIISPESRIVKKGLDKIEKSSFEIFISVVNQREIEILELKKNLFKFNSLAQIIISLGIFGTSLSFISFFTREETNFLAKDLYNSLFPLSIGALLALVMHIFKMILVSSIYKIEVNLKIRSNEFLEIVAESK